MRKQRDEETDVSNESSISTWINSSGYTYASTGERMVGIHYLLAIAKGSDPNRVFAEETEVNHQLASPVKIDTRENVLLLHQRNHRDLHTRDRDHTITPASVVGAEPIGSDYSKDSGRQGTNAD
jgi:hypothetical protein